MRSAWSYVYRKALSLHKILKICLFKNTGLNMTPITELLKCGVCLENSSFPIRTCSGGHVVCGLCHKQVKQCPLCKGELHKSPLGERLSRQVGRNHVHVVVISFNYIDLILVGAEWDVYIFRVWMHSTNFVQ
jgi:hypothetical protein